MNTYRKIYRKAKKICKREGVRLIETELDDKNLIYVYFDDERKIVWNKDHPEYKEITKV